MWSVWYTAHTLSSCSLYNKIVRWVNIILQQLEMGLWGRHNKWEISPLTNTLKFLEAEIGQFLLHLYFTFSWLSAVISGNHSIPSSLWLCLPFIRTHKRCLIATVCCFYSSAELCLSPWVRATQVPVILNPSLNSQHHYFQFLSIFLR